MSEPIACNLGLIEADSGPEARQRHEEVSTSLLARLVRTEERVDGTSMLFEADVDTLALIGEFIARERLCCPFLRFRLELEPHGDFVRLELAGSAETKAFLKAELFSKL